MEQEGDKPWEEVFKAGQFQVKTRDTTKHGSTTAAPPPKPLLLSFPAESGEYPVLLFIHGFWLSNSYYTQLLHHIASHGYITIAPQMDLLTGFDATAEIADAAAISNWLAGGLSYYLPEEVRPDVQNVVIAGHSRGGKVAFGVALDRSGITKVKFSAIVGIDPVDGTSSGHQTEPHILTYKPHSFDLDMPALVIGSGLGSEWKGNFFFPPCAPELVNHREFFSECSVPAHHFVASEFGHMDFLNDGLWISCISVVCKNGATREPMRRFSGGIIVAFLNAYLKNDSGAFNDLLVHPGHAPVLLEPPQSFVSEVESVEFPLLQKI